MEDIQSLNHNINSYKIVEMYNLELLTNIFLKLIFIREFVFFFRWSDHKFYPYKQQA